MSNSNKLPLRIGVGIILLNNENNVFVGKRIDNPKNSWQMPQGGVDQNESFLQAAKRELEEETGIKSVKLIKKLDGWFKYDLPKNLHFHQLHLAAFAKNFWGYQFSCLQIHYFYHLAKLHQHQFLVVIYFYFASNINRQEVLRRNLIGYLYQY